MKDDLISIEKTDVSKHVVTKSEKSWLYQIWEVENKEENYKLNAEEGRVKGQEWEWKEWESQDTWYEDKDKKGVVGLSFGKTFQGWELLMMAGA